jgi:hypothetical protein
MVFDFFKVGRVSCTYSFGSLKAIHSHLKDRIWRWHLSWITYQFCPFPYLAVREYSGQFAQFGSLIIICRIFPRGWWFALSFSKDLR